MAWKSPYVIHLSELERVALTDKARHRSSQHRDVIRSRMILMAAEGMDNGPIAAQLGVDRKTVSRWRKRFFEERLRGLEERPRPGRPRRFSPRSGGGRKVDSL
jgi:transposase-like protein